MRTLVPHRPARADIFDGLDSIFDSFFAEPTARRHRAPAVDIREEHDGYLVHADLPGVSEKDLKVSIDDNVLTISANADENGERTSESYLVRERRQAAFTRSLVLPGDADHEAVAATFKDGLLTLRVPKNQTRKAREILINAG